MDQEMNIAKGEQKQQKKKYQKLDDPLRKEVIYRVIELKQSLKDVARDLNIKYCSCRMIKKNYEKQGQISKSKTRKKKMFLLNKIEVNIKNCSVPTLNLTLEKEILVNKSNEISEEMTDQIRDILSEKILYLIDNISDIKEKQGMMAATKHLDERIYNEISNNQKQKEEQQQDEVKNNELKQYQMLLEFQKQQQNEAGQSQFDISQQVSIFEPEYQEIAMQLLQQINKQKHLQILQSKISSYYLNTQLRLLENMSKQQNSKQ